MCEFDFSKLDAILVDVVGGVETIKFWLIDAFKAVSMAVYLTNCIAMGYRL